MSLTERSLLSPQEIQKYQEEAQFKIINSISQRGLISAAVLLGDGVDVLHSSDKNLSQCTNVCSRVIFDPNDQTITREPLPGGGVDFVLGYRAHFYMWESDTNEFLTDCISGLLYSGFSSVFPVIAERKNEDSEKVADTQILSERCKNCLIFVANPIEDDILRRSEVLSPQIKLENIHTIFCPINLLEIVESHFPGIDIVGVGYKVVKLFPGTESEKEVEALDVEEKIKLLIQATGGHKLVHGVRLPTYQDIECGLI